MLAHGQEQRWSLGVRHSVATFALRAVLAQTNGESLVAELWMQSITRGPSVCRCVGLPCRAASGRQEFLVVQKLTVRRIWTIGHSTRSIDDFVDILHQHKIEVLADVRHFPGSRRFPHFNKPELNKALADERVRYEHFVDLGGRRAAKPDSHNLAWRNESFRGYADYMETPPFGAAIQRLVELTSTGRTAIMCSEAVWWRCHRSLIADFLKVDGWQVLHIMDAAKTQEHPYTSAAAIVDGKLSYRGIIDA